MNLSGNVIFITGGTSGIGQALAEALHARGNTVIISGRRRSHLDAIVAANPGMRAIELDVSDPASIDRAAQTLLVDHPDLNVLINNAGIMETDNAAGAINDVQMQRIVATNLMGSIRMSSALMEQLKSRDNGVVAYMSSVLAFAPLAFTAVYSATKAALHSYAMSQRFLLKGKVQVLEIAPPWVRTDLMNSREAQAAMPLDQFIDEAMAILATDADEIVVDAAKALRAATGPGEHETVDGFNTLMTEVMGRSH